MNRTTVFLAAVGLMIAACLCPAQPAEAAKGFLYGPYLQNVTPSSLSLVWVSNLQKPVEGEATLTGPDGKTVTTKVAVKGPCGHAVFTEGLAAGTTYKFQVKLADGAVAEGQAATAPDKPTDFRFIAYGDTRTGVQVHEYLIKKAMEHKPNFILHTGDFVDEGDDWAAWKDECLDVLVPYMRSTPLYPAIGNHDLSWSQEGETTVDLYARIFDVPDVKGAGERWYSFQWGDATFFVLDHYAPFGPDTPQHKWLEAALAACKTTWKFAVHHDPPFSSSRRNGSAGAREDLVPLFEKYKVNAVFNGHDHGYSRSEKAGVVYIVAAGGGAPLYPVQVTENPYEKISRSCYQYCIVDVTAAKVTITTYDVLGKKFDEVTLPKPAPATAPAATP